MQFFSAPLLRLSPRTALTGAGDASALANVSTTILPDGCVCWVTGAAPASDFRLRKSSVAVPDGVNVIAPGSGPGRWFRVAGSAGGGPSQIVWQPGTPTTALHVATWAEVYAGIQATDSRVQVMVDDQLGAASVPAGFYDLGGRVEISALVARFGFSGPPTAVVMDDGAVFHNLYTVQENIRLETHQTAAPALTFDSFAIFAVWNGGVLDNQGSRPVIDVGAGTALAFRLKNGGTVSGNMPVIDLVGAATLALNATDLPFLINDWISGDPASTLIYLTDDTFAPPTLAGFAGTYSIDLRGSKADRDTPAAGDTASRPSGGVPFGPLLGQMYFDTDLTKPIWWDGTQWVDATGAPA